MIEGLICLICYIPPGSIQSIIQLDRQKDKRLIKILRERKVNMEQFTKQFEIHSRFENINMYRDFSHGLKYISREN